MIESLRKPIIHFIYIGLFLALPLYETIRHIVIYFSVTGYEDILFANLSSYLVVGFVIIYFKFFRKSLHRRSSSHE